VDRVTGMFLYNRLELLTRKRIFYLLVILTEPSCGMRL